MVMIKTGNIDFSVRTVTISAALAAMLLSACAGNREWIDGVRAEDIDYEKDVEWLDVPADSIGVPSDMAVSGSFLAWSESAGNRMLYIYGLESGKTYTPVKKGRASEELLNINQLMPRNGGFYVVDIFKHILCGYGYDSVRDVFIRESLASINEFCVVAVARDTVVGVLTDGQARYGVRASDGRIVKSFGDYAEYGLNNREGWGLLQGKMCCSPVLGRFAIFSYYTVAYEILDMNAAAVVASEVLDMSSYDSNSHKFITMRPESKIGFISLTASDDRIYALYDGKNLKHYMDNRGIGMSGNDIVVFDWEGQYRSRLHSDRPVSCIAWNETDKSMYLCVLSDDGEYRFCRLRGGT